MNTQIENLKDRRKEAINSTCKLDVAVYAMNYLGIMILLKLMLAHLKRGRGEIPMLSAKTPIKVIKLNLFMRGDTLWIKNKKMKIRIINQKGK